MAPNCLSFPVTDLLIKHLPGLGSDVEDGPTPEVHPFCLHKQSLLWLQEQGLTPSFRPRERGNALVPGQLSIWPSVTNILGALRLWETCTYGVESHVLTSAVCSWGERGLELLFA